MFPNFDQYDFNFVLVTFVLFNFVLYFYSFVLFTLVLATAVGRYLSPPLRRMRATYDAMVKPI